MDVILENEGGPVQANYGTTQDNANEGESFPEDRTSNKLQLSMALDNADGPYYQGP